MYNIYSTTVIVLDERYKEQLGSSADEPQLVTCDLLTLDAFA